MAELSREQQKALALARARQRASQGGAHPQATGFKGGGGARRATDYLGHVNRPIMRGLDIVTEPFERLAGVELDDIARRQGVAIADQPAESYGERAAEGVGLAATALIPGGAAVGQATKAASPMVSGAAKSLAQPFLRSPVATTAAEIGAGAGAGLGGKAAEEAGAPRWAGELAGGAALFAPYGAMRAADTVMGKLPLYSWGKRNLLGMTEAGGRQRAHERLREISGQPGKDIDALSEPDEFGLTAAQRTGNPRMMQLERSVRDVDPEFDVATREQIEGMDAKLAQALKDMSEGATAQDAARYIRGARAVAEDTLQRHVMEAERAAGEKLAKLAPEMRETEASAVFRSELDKAMKAARAQERELWGAVPQDVPVPTRGVREAFQTFKGQLSRAQQDDLPDVAVRLLDPDRNSAFTDQETVKEVHGLYSRLREEARKARAAGEPNKARVADGLAEAALKDLESVEGVEPAMEAARAFSRQLNQTFRQGRVGDILGFEREGGASVPPEMTLGQTIGSGGARGAVAADELRRAVGDSPDAERAMRDYMRRRFQEFAAPRGEFKPERATDFLRQNNELLDRFPELKREIQEATESGQFAGEARRTVDEGLKEARTSPAGRFADERVTQVGREFESILSNPNPPRAAALLVREARNDPSGKALGGLKDAALDYLMRHRGETSLATFRKALQDERIGGAIRTILSKDEMQRLGRIVGTMERARLADKATPAAGGIIDDTPSTILNTIAGILGAQVGRRVAAGTGGGTVQTPGIFANRFRGALARLTTDTAEKLLKDAVKDPDLMKSLMISPNVPPKRITGRLRAWLAAETGVLGAEEGEAEQSPAGPSPQADMSQSGVRPEALKRMAAGMAKRFGVEADLYQKVIEAESNWNPQAVSPKGAFGLSQAMADTARQPGFGVVPMDDPNNPVEQLRFGAQYLGAMLRRYKGDKTRALVAYNWGPGHADNWNGRMDSLPNETRNYVKKILGS